MKKLILLVLFLINISIAYGQIDIRLVKDSYLTGETFQAEFFLTQIPLRELDVANIFLELNNTRISIAPILINLERDHYFVYFDLINLIEGTYDFGITLLYDVDGILREIPVKKSFNVIGGNGINLRPALLNIDAQDLSFVKVTLENRNDININVNLSRNELFTLSRDNIDLQGITSRILYIYPKESIVNIDKTVLLLSYDNSSYILPIFIYNKKVEVADNITEETIETSNESLEQAMPINFLDINEINKSIKENQFSLETLKFVNLLNTTIARINFSLSGNLNEIIRLKQNNFYNVISNSTYEQVLFINEQRNASKRFYYGNIILSTDTYSTAIPAYVYILEREIKPEKNLSLDEEQEPVIEETPEEINEDEEHLEFAPESSLEPKEEKKQSNVAIILVLMIFIIVLALSIFFIFKYRK